MEQKKYMLELLAQEIKFPDFYGVDMPTKEELLANDKSISSMCNHIQAASLRFLSLDGLYKALTGKKQEFQLPQFSDHYFTGDYPIKPEDNLQGLKLNNYLYLVVSQIINQLLKFYFSYPISTTLNY